MRENTFLVWMKNCVWGLWNSSRLFSSRDAHYVPKNKLTCREKSHLRISLLVTQENKTTSAEMNSLWERERDSVSVTTCNLLHHWHECEIEMTQHYHDKIHGNILDSIKMSPHISECLIDPFLLKWESFQFSVWHANWRHVRSSWVSADSGLKQFVFRVWSDSQSFVDQKK